MGLSSFFQSLFGGGEAKPSEPVEYKGFLIEAAPINEDGKYRTAGYISGELDGETRRIQFIRADQNSSLEAAIAHAITKGQQIIDEQGNSLLNKSHL